MDREILNHLFLNIAGMGINWQERVVIANSSSISVYSDIGYNANLGLVNLSSRNLIIVQCPSGTRPRHGGL